MSESPFSSSNHCFGINKTDRSDVLDYASSSASLPTAKLFTTTNTITKLGLLIPGRDVLNSLSKQELLWWVKKFSNGRSLRQKEPNLVIQTDASNQISKISH